MIYITGLHFMWHTQYIYLHKCVIREHKFKKGHLDNRIYKTSQSSIWYVEYFCASYILIFLSHAAKASSFSSQSCTPM